MDGWVYIAKDELKGCTKEKRGVSKLVGWVSLSVIYIRFQTLRLILCIFTQSLGNLL